MITGASWVFDSAVALELGNEVGAGSIVLSMACSSEDLETTKDILYVRGARPELAISNI